MATAWGPQIHKATFLPNNPTDAAEVAIATVDGSGSSELTSWAQIAGVLNFFAIDADCTNIIVTVYRGTMAGGDVVGSSETDLPATPPANYLVPYAIFDSLSPVKATTLYTITVTMVGASAGSTVDGSLATATLF